MGKKKKVSGYNQGSMVRVVTGSVDAPTSDILDPELREKLGEDTNRLVMLPGEKAPSRPEDTNRADLKKQEEELRKLSKLNKAQKKKLEKVQEKRRKIELRDKAMASLKQHELPSDHLKLLRSSGHLGRKDSLKETLKRVMNEKKVGISITDDSRLEREHILHMGDDAEEVGSDSGSEDASERDTLVASKRSAEVLRSPGADKEDGSEGPRKAKKRKTKPSRTNKAAESSLIALSDSSDSDVGPKKPAATDDEDAKLCTEGGKSKSYGEESNEGTPEGSSPSKPTHAASAAKVASPVETPVSKKSKKTKKSKSAENKMQEEPSTRDHDIDMHTEDAKEESDPSAPERGKRKYVVVSRTEEIEEARMDLPVCGMEQEIMEAVAENDVVVICGETGSGKTTQVPQFLYEYGYANTHSDGKPAMIGVTQPRRVAATTMARRVATEMNVTVGTTVGYHVRYDCKAGNATAVKFMTDGILLRELQSDFLLSRYSVLILDEAHERNINTDVLVGMLSRIVRLRREMYEAPSSHSGLHKDVIPLKLIVMSATLRVDDFVKNTRLFSPPPALIKVNARQYPVTIHFNRHTREDYTAEALKKVCKIHRNLPLGHVLVFLTGRNEVHDLERKLRRQFPKPIRMPTAANKDTSLAEDKDDADGEGAGGNGGDGTTAHVPMKDSLIELAEKEILQERTQTLPSETNSGDGDGARAITAADEPEAFFSDEEGEGDGDSDGGRGEEGENEDGDGAGEESHGRNKRKKGGWDDDSSDGADSDLCGRDPHDMLDGAGDEDDEEVREMAAAMGDELVAEDEQARAADEEAGGNQEAALSGDPGDSDLLHLKVLVLYAMLPLAQQAKVFADVPPNTRLVVIATNVAETSITIPGVRYVVDAGKAKVKEYDDRFGMARYRVSWTSQASADQRAGRAGRVGPGHCYRLYSSAVMMNSFEKFSEPELVRTPVEGVVLYMKALRIDKVENFPFPTPPSFASLDTATRLLRRLGALSGPGDALTPLGEKMSRLPLHPRYGKMLLLGAESQVFAYLCRIVAILAVGNELFLPDSMVAGAAAADTENKNEDEDGAADDDDPKAAQKLRQRAVLKMKRDAEAKYADDKSDLIKLLRAFLAYERSGGSPTFIKNNYMHSRTVLDVQSLNRQLRTLFPAEDQKTQPPADPRAKECLRIRQVIAGGFVDQVARKIPGGKKMAPGSHPFPYRTCLDTPEDVTPAFIHPTSCIDSSSKEGAAFLVYSELVSSSSERRLMRLVTSIRPAWLHHLGPALTTLSQPLDDPPPYFDSGAGETRCHREASYGNESWPLPVVQTPFPAVGEGADKRYRYFARFLLEGKVFPKLASYLEDGYKWRPAMLTKGTGGQAHQRQIVATLAASRVGSRQELIRKWAEHPRFLLPEVHMWLRSKELKRDLEGFWPLVSP